MTYNSLEDIQRRKDELQTGLRKHSELLGVLWHELVTPQKANTKGELVAHLVSNSITAIDAFLLVRKLMKKYNGFFGRKKRK